MVEFSVKKGDILEEPSDLLLLKHAQEFWGADKVVAERLVSAGICALSDLRAAIGQAVVVDTGGCIGPSRVMFQGTPPLAGFDYAQMRIFAMSAVKKIAASGLPIRRLTTTVHGSGYGLDAGESMQRLASGFQAGWERYRSGIEEIVFLTLSAREERMLCAALPSNRARPAPSEIPASASFSAVPRTIPEKLPEAPAGAPAIPEPTAKPPSAEKKKRVFVAMPYSSEDCQNAYEYGIYPAVRSCGLICERVDETHFTGDILGRIQSGIENANLVIADLTEARPNVYLEVGYAWGKGIPVIFVARKSQELHFDVRGHRCVLYGFFPSFAQELEQLLRGLQSEGRL